MRLLHQRPRVRYLLLNICLVYQSLAVRTSDKLADRVKFSSGYVQLAAPVAAGMRNSSAFEMLCPPAPVYLHKSTPTCAYKILYRSVDQLRRMLSGVMRTFNPIAANLAYATRLNVE